MVSFFKPLIVITIFLFVMQNTRSQSREFIVSIPFKTNSSIVENKYLPLLDSLIDKLKQYPGFDMKMYGFADTTGTEKYNDRLSEERVVAVFNYIKSAIPLNNKNTYVDHEGEFGERYDLHFSQAHVQKRYVDIKVYLKK